MFPPDLSIRLGPLLLPALLACEGPGASERFVTVALAPLPPSADKLELLPFLNERPSGEPVLYEGLSASAERGEASLLLRLPLDVSGRLLVAAGARDSQGCLLSTGTADLSIVRGRPARELRVPLSPIEGRDVACQPGAPVLTSAAFPGLDPPGLLSTKGGAEIAVSGFGFHPRARMTLGGLEAEGQAWASPLLMTGFAPPLPGRVGPLQIAIRNPDGVSGARADLGRTYLDTVQFDAPVEKLLGPAVSSQQTAPNPLVLADVSGDGREDLITYFIEADTLKHYVSVSLFTGGEAGPFAAPARTDLPGQARVINGGTRIVPADMNGDGRVDLVVAYSTDFPSFEPRVLLNQGEGRFPSDGGILVASFNIGSIDDLAVGDVNGDGRPDVLCSGGSLGRYFIYTNQGGTFSFAADINVGGAGGLPVHLRVADIDRDGLPDVVVVRGNRQEVLIRYGVGGGRLPAQQVALGTSLTSPNGLEVMDVDGDGLPDLVLIGDAPGLSGRRIALLRSTGKGLFAAEEEYTLPGPFRDIPALADLNGDGLLDLLTVYRLAGFRVDIALRRREGGFESLGQLEGVALSHGAAVMDTDSDGRLDIVRVTTSMSGPGSFLSLLRSTAR